MTHPSDRAAGFTTAPRTQLSGGGPLFDAGLKERRCQLTVLSGDSTGRVVEIDKPLFTVGKEGADLALTDPTVSREHFVIEQQSGAFVIRDKKSTNGTWIDQFRIREAWLHPGVVVRAGEVELRFEPLFKPMDVAPSQQDRFGSLVGKSVRMRQIFALLERVAKTDATVVILGETGSGKSAVARAIHESSDRGGGPLVTVDCGAIAENLIESELFGHERGAFTGALKARQGALEQAQGGTLFIDELADLRLDLQPKLLRVLEEREVRRVGSNDPIKLDVRIIAASRKDLWREVEAGRFREDLYFRLAVFTIPLPPLRDRNEDIPLLAAEFARSLKGGDKLLARVPPSSMQQLRTHPFYGNVRELRNVIERAIYLDGDPTDFLGPLPGIPHDAAAKSSPSPVAPIAAPAMSAPAASWQPPSKTLANGNMLVDESSAPDVAPGAFSVDVDWSQPFKEAKEQLLERFELEYLRRVLERTDGGASAAAREAGIDRKHLYNLAKKHGLDLGKDRG